MEFYQRILYKALRIAKPSITPSRINAYLESVNGNLGNKHAHFRALRAFSHWLYNQKSGIELNPHDNPMLYVEAPEVPKLILPSLTKEQVELLLVKADNVRDKAIIALFTESGLRLSELANICPKDIDWYSTTIRIIGKGKKEAYAPFGRLSGKYMREWLAQYQPDANIWGLESRGIQHMLESLRRDTSLPCNPHTFRRTFACLLRKAGVDTMTIKDLGRWGSLEMVQRYTRSVSFQDSMKFYKAPLG